MAPPSILEKPVVRVEEQHVQIVPDGAQTLIEGHDADQPDHYAQSDARSWRFALIDIPPGSKHTRSDSLTDGFVPVPLVGEREAAAVQTADNEPGVSATM